jgi:hydroxymethylpyrimidine/phosphomethylpyrimidine kinase
VNGRVLIIAGSDSSGGAGIQADIKTVTALGAYAATAITALTAQDTTGVHAIHDVPAAFLKQQIEAVAGDIGADAIKIGMVHTAEQMNVVGDALDGPLAGLPVVLDPVMVAKGGASLMDPRASQTFRARLLLRASVLTPNLPEAEALTGYKIGSVEEMIHAGEMLRTYGARAVLVKGGHLPGRTVIDVLVVEDGVERFEGPRIESRHTHGTGCTLASAIAAGLAQGLSLSAATRRARHFVEQAIRSAPGLGKGHGPLNHAHAIPPYTA